MTLGCQQGSPAPNYSDLTRLRFGPSFRTQIKITNLNGRIIQQTRTNIPIIPMADTARHHDCCDSIGDNSDCTLGTR